MCFGEFWVNGLIFGEKHIWERDLVLLCWELQDCELSNVIELEGKRNMSMTILSDIIILSNSGE